MTQDSQPHPGITRQTLEGGHLRAMIAEAGFAHLCLSDAELDASLAAVRPPPGEEVWVFGYGSLIWNPVFHPVERRPGLLHGWHRRFCFWVPAGRGTPDCPGLMMGLEPGGCCRGILLRMAADEAGHELPLLWRREMVTGAYVPRRIPVRTPHGPVHAITFTANRRHLHYAGGLPFERVAGHIRKAQGPLGRNRDYLWRTVQMLRELGIPDRGLETLNRAVLAADRPNG